MNLAPTAAQPKPANTAKTGRTALMARRLRYMARFVYWTVRHRSTRHVRWVLAFEGTTW